MSIDNTLINLMKKGDNHAFRQFVEFYSSPLFYYATGIVRDEKMAEEVVSDVFMEVWNNRDTLDSINSMKKWLFVVTYRKSISQLRKKTEKVHDRFDEIEDFHFSPLQSPEEELISKEEIARINKIIDGLPTRCKHVFFLAKMERFSYKEIAEMLNISVKTVNNHITYALKEIIKALKNSSK